MQHRDEAVGLQAWRTVGTWWSQRLAVCQASLIQLLSLAQPHHGQLLVPAYPSRAGAAQSVRLRMHPSSVLFRSRPQWCVFSEVQQSDGGAYEMQGVTAVPEPQMLVEAAPHMYSRKGPGPG